jgi:two-component system chemotaxis response regulator CheY
MAQLDSTRPSPAPTVPPPNLAPVVLIADNEATLLELFRDALADDQLRVLTATNGREALALAEKCVPDVLVTDVVMPRLDGFGLVGAVRRLYPDIPVIIMTGDATYQDRPIEALAAEVGAVATFLKPFDLAELHQAVRGVISPREPASFARDGATGSPRDGAGGGREHRAA